MSMEDELLQVYKVVGTPDLEIPDSMRMAMFDKAFVLFDKVLESLRKV